MLHSKSEKASNILSFIPKMNWRKWIKWPRIFYYLKTENDSMMSYNINTIIVAIIFFPFFLISFVVVVLRLRLFFSWAKPSCCCCFCGCDSLNTWLLALLSTFSHFYFLLLLMLLLFYYPHNDRKFQFNSIFQSISLFNITRNCFSSAFTIIIITAMDSLTRISTFLKFFYFSIFSMLIVHKYFHFSFCLNWSKVCCKSNE